MTLVTLVVVSYNYAPFLREALESAVAQTYRPLEILVADDGSTDGSVEIAGGFDVELHAHENYGLARNCNDAVERSRGEYVTFLSADDRFEPTYVEELMRALEAAGASFAYSDMRLFGAESRVKRSRTFSAVTLVNGGNYVNGSALTSRADYLDAGGYAEDLDDIGYEDWDFWLRMIERGRRGTYLPRPLLHWRRHERGSRNPDLAPDVERVEPLIRRRHPELFERCRGRRDPILAPIGQPPLARSARVRRLAEEVSWRYFERLTSRS